MSYCSLSAQYLVHEKNFSEDRVRKTIARIVANKGKANQGRLESFFSVVPKAAPAAGAAKDAKGACVHGLHIYSFIVYFILLINAPCACSNAKDAKGALCVLRGCMLVVNDL